MDLSRGKGMNTCDNKLVFWLLRHGRCSEKSGKGKKEEASWSVSHLCFKYQMDHVVITRFFHALTIQPPSQSFPLNLTFAGLLMMAGTPAYTIYYVTL